MAFEANRLHEFGFLDDPGHVTSDYTIDIFHKDGLAVSTSTLTSFTVTQVSSGYYYAQYTPSSAGFYVIGISRTGIKKAIDVADIEEANFVDLTQDTPTANALKPSLPVVRTPFPVPLNEYVLMVFASSDWDVGRKTAHFAVAMTELDVNGNWRTTPLTISPGTYHIVIQNNIGVQVVIKAYLEV